MAKHEDALSDFSWASFKKSIRSRMARRVKNNLGIIPMTGNMNDVGLYRSAKLEKLDSYFENRQYNHLQPWDEACANSDEYIAIRQRKPRVIYPFAKNLSERLTAKICGESVFPKFLIQESPDDQEFINAVIRESNLRHQLNEPFKRMLATGSVFVRFWIVEGKYKLEWFKSKYCYPEFQDNGELESVVIEYVYVDHDELDEKGNPKRKWYKLELTTTSEILYDNPEYQENVEPVYQEVDRLDHNLGFVQGEWFRTSESSVDGSGFLHDILDFVDEFNYSLSQSSQAVSYNQDPQLVINKMDEEELGTLIRSAMKHWNLGREGEAKFLEAGLEGVVRAMEMRDKVKLNISDITRITLLDPEKLVGSAQSAKAMEVLHGPLKDLVDDVRAVVGGQMKNLILKMALATLIANKSGILTPIVIPQGYVPASMDLQVKWPQLFQQTVEDMAKKVALTVQAKNGGVISTITAIKHIAEDFGIDDIEAEAKLIEAERAAIAALNPFGGF